MDRYNRTVESADRIDAYFYISKMLARLISIAIVGGEAQKTNPSDIRPWPLVAFH
jgi:hypothetical protein